MVLVRFSPPVLHSVVAKGSLGGLTALLATVATRTPITELVTLGNRILLIEVFPTTVTSVLPSSG